MATKCAAITLGGKPCKGLVRPGNEYCPAHDPARQEARKRAASKAGKSKPSRELSDIKRRLSDLAEEILEGRTDRSDAAVAGQLLNTVIRAVGVELKVREQEEVLARVEELEALLKNRDAAEVRYGA